MPRKLSKFGKSFMFLLKYDSTKPFDESIDQKLSKSLEDKNIDQPLYHFGLRDKRLINDDHENYKKSNPVKRWKRLNNHIINFWHFCNITRLLLGLLSDSKFITLMVGDFSILWGKPRIIYSGPIFGWHCMALLISIIYHSAPDKEQQWLDPFRLWIGQRTPHDVMFKIMRQVHLWKRRNRLIFFIARFMVINSVIVGGILFLSTSVYLYPRSHLILGIIWGIDLTLETYVISGCIKYNFAYFHSLCYYLVLRYKDINREIDFILSELRENKLLSKRNAMLYEILTQHNQLSQEVAAYDCFWMKYIGIMYFFYVPLNCLLLYVILFVKTHTFAWIFNIVLFCESFLILLIVIFSASMVPFEVHKSYIKLNSLCVKTWPTELALKLSHSVPRIGSHIIGFTCLKLFSITYSRFGEMLALFGSSFLLTIDMLNKNTK